MRILALTIVTGLGDNDLVEIGFERSCKDQVIRLAQLAEYSGCHGVIASPQETKSLRAVLADHMLIITPGIRPEGKEKNEQYRVGTPAIKSGASYITVGRPIVQAAMPEEAAREINVQIRLAANA
jgi:orotidine-5'-phosphate decarboxylase